MASCPTSIKTKRVAVILRRIPCSSSDMAKKSSICDNFDGNSDLCSNCIDDILWILGFFDAIETSGECVKSRNQTAYYFLQSLSHYFSSGLNLGTQWVAPVFREHTRVLDMGHRIVANMEQIRRDIDGAEPLRRAHIAHVVIKARVGWDGFFRDRYLVRYDSRKRHYELIGEHVYDELYVPGADITVSDKQNERAIKNELVSIFQNFQEQHIERLRAIATVPFRDISASLGAYTEYVFFVYECALSIPQVSLADGIHFKWVTHDELITPQQPSGINIYATSLKKIYKHSRKRIKQIRRSLDWQDKPQWKDVLPALWRCARMIALWFVRR